MLRAMFQNSSSDESDSDSDHPPASSSQQRPLSPSPVPGTSSSTLSNSVTGRLSKVVSGMTVITDESQGIASQLWPAAEALADFVLTQVSS